MKYYTRKQLEAINIFELRRLAKELYKIDFKDGGKVKIKNVLITEFLQAQQSKDRTRIALNSQSPLDKKILEELVLTLFINERSDMVDMIKKYSIEEYETHKDFWELAKLNDANLRKIIFDIFKYYLQK